MKIGKPVKEAPSAYGKYGELWEMVKNSIDGEWIPVECENVGE